MSAPSPPRSRTPAGLSSGAIVDAAIALIEAEGAGALSMRKVAARLGVEAMSLYNHVPGRESLLSAIAERLFDPLGEVELDGDWREVAHRFGVAIRGIALAYPETFKAVGFRPLQTMSSLAGVERLLGGLVDGGLSPVHALACYRAVASFARGYALAQATGFTVEAATRAGRQRLAALPSDAFPILAGATGQLGQLSADDGFEQGLAALLAGFSSRR